MLCPLLPRTAGCCSRTLPRTANRNCLLPSAGTVSSSSIPVLSVTQHFSRGHTSLRFPLYKWNMPLDSRLESSHQTDENRGLESGCFGSSHLGNQESYTKAFPVPKPTNLAVSQGL